MRIVATSDTHTNHKQLKIPDGDVFIHGGDLTRRGELETIEDFANLLKELPHKRKICIFGNHELGLEYGPNRQRAIDLITNAGADYLEDSGVEIDGKKFWGSPITPLYHNWAWNRDRGEQIKGHWDKIPLDTNVLITHGPPFSILDRNLYEMNVGCEELLKKLDDLKNLKLHIFGHIHEAYGIVEKNNVIFANVCACLYKFEPTHLPMVIDI